MMCGSRSPPPERTPIALSCRRPGQASNEINLDRPGNRQKRMGALRIGGVPAENLDGKKGTFTKAVDKGRGHSGFSPSPRVKTLNVPLPARLSGKRLEVEEERELRLEVLDELVVRGDEFTLLLLGQGDVQTVVDADAGFGGDIAGPQQEGKRGVEFGQRAEDIRQQRDGGADRDAFLPLGTRGRVPNLDGEHVGGQQFVDRVLVVRTQLPRLVREG